MRRLATTALVAAVAALICVVAVPAPAPAAGIEAYDLRSPAQERCAAVDTSTPFVSGGCRALAYEFSTVLTIRTLYGALPFGDCTTAFDMSIAGDGRFWLDDIRIGGESPCNDIRPCAPAKVLDELKGPYDGLPLRDALPWTGRVLAGEGRRFTGRVDVCFDTCVGRYAGPVEVSLLRGERGWALRANDAGVGVAGLAVAGEWELDPGRFGLRSRG